MQKKKIGVPKPTYLRIQGHRCNRNTSPVIIILFRIQLNSRGMVIVKTLQLRRPMDQGSVLHDHIIAMGGSHTGEI